MTRRIPDNATVVVCGFRRDDTPWDDNIEGHCQYCNVEIQWRPHSPSGPDVIRICAFCMEAELQAMEDAGEALPIAQITEETRREAKEHLGIVIKEKTKH